MSSPAANWVGRRCETEVGQVAHGGHCVARVDGRVVFVRHALPGERVIIEVTWDNGGSYCRADAVEILNASPDRVASSCPVSGPGGCGGCDFQHVATPAQRALKAAVVAEQLRRLAGVEWPVEVRELPGGALRWRTRARLAVGQDGRPGFRAQHSHRVVPVDDCPITAAGALHDVLSDRHPPGGEVDVALDGEGNQHVAVSAPRRSGRRGARSVLRGGVAVQYAAGREWRLSAQGFWQVHAAAADVLAETVGQFAQVRAGGTAWDLYGGVGLFGSVLAGQVGSGGSVAVVESERRAVEDGRRNLADLPQVRFVPGRVDRLLSARRLRPANPRVVVLDPPRSGAGRGVVDGIAAAGAHRVVYVACDPAALARDVALFAGHHYRLRDLRAFDAFPMTHHVECVALLTRDR